MRCLTTLFVLITMHITVSAQSIERQVFSTAGLSTPTVEFTIGETLTSTFGSSVSIVTQGFQQGELTDIDVLEVGSDAVLSLYPNPTRMAFQVDGQRITQPIQLDIVDVDGKLIESHANILLRQTIDITHLAAGTYIIRIDFDATQPKKYKTLIKL